MVNRPQCGASPAVASGGGIREWEEPPLPSVPRGPPTGCGGVTASSAGKALGIWQTALGEEHPHISILYNNMANVHRNTAKYDQALEYYGNQGCLFFLKGTQPPARQWPVGAASPHSPVQLGGGRHHTPVRVLCGSGAMWDAPQKPLRQWGAPGPSVQRRNGTPVPPSCPTSPMQVFFSGSKRAGNSKPPVILGHLPGACSDGGKGVSSKFPALPPSNVLHFSVPTGPRGPAASPTT